MPESILFFACAGENFADKWNDYEARRLKFDAWRASVEQDLTGFLLETKGAVALHQRIAKAFGNAPVEEALRVLGARTNRARENGNVHFATGGLLTTAVTATAIPKKNDAATKITAAAASLRWPGPAIPAATSAMTAAAGSIRTGLREMPINATKIIP